MMYLRWIARDLRNHVNFTLLFCASLSLGLIGFISLDAMQISLRASFKEVSRSAMGADLEIDSRQPIDPNKRAEARNLIVHPFEEAEKISLFSMVSGTNKSKLVNVQGISNAFPFYGEFQLVHAGRVTGSMTSKLNQEPIIWLRHDIAAMLGVDVKETIKLGNLEFIVDDFIDSDTTDAFNGFELAPRAYVGIDFLKQTGLIVKGSRVKYRVFYKLNAEEDLKSLETKLEALLPDPRIEIESHSTKASNIGRAITFFSDYLSLVALAALFLAAIGVTFIFRNYLSRRRIDLAILKVLGLNRRRLLTLYFFKLGLFGVFATVITLGLVAVILPLLGHLLEPVIPFGADPKLTLETGLLTALIAIFSSLTIATPTLIQASETPPSELLHDNESKITSLRQSKWLFWIPVLLMYWLLAMFQADSYKLGSLFIALFFAAVLFLVMAARATQKCMRFISATNFAIRYSLRNISRSSRRTVLIFVVLALSSMLMNLIPQLYSNIEGEFDAPEKSARPSLFLTNIQEYQIDEIKSFLNEQNSSLSTPLPMITSRLIELNGQSFKRAKKDGLLDTREEKRRRGFTNRTFNLTFRDNPSALNDSIVEGNPFSGVYDANSEKSVELSVEQRFAKRLGFNLGDELVFDVQGVLLRTKIVNIRTVRWTTFRPNFFVEVQPGALDGAPGSYLATVPRVDEKDKIAIQNGLASTFPNLSIIDLDATVDTVLDIVSRMSSALMFMALLVLVVGLFVLSTIVWHHTQRQRYAIGLLKVLGASFATVRIAILFEFVAIAFFGLAYGAVLAFIASYIFATAVFQNLWQPDWMMALVVSLTIFAASLIVVFLGADRAIQTQANELILGSN